MPPVIIKGRRQWDVDGGGIATVVVPGLGAPVVTQVNSKAMDSQINRLTDQVARLTAERDAAQVEIDELSTNLTDMTALRATVTAEPEA